MLFMKSDFVLETKHPSDPTSITPAWMCITRKQKTLKTEQRKKYLDFEREDKLKDKEYEELIGDETGNLHFRCN
jgi:hypothetical protein